ncbi:MAG: Vms1/Ankzf1 family peptidyl-tRNA hydrolase [Thermoplasmatota archaeon]
MPSCSQALHELSDIYDEDSSDTYVSLYYDGRDKRFLRRRTNAIRRALGKEARENFEATMEHIQEYLEEQRGPVAIFASSRHDFFYTMHPTTTPDNALIVDSSPYIRPLAALADEWRAFSLLLLNHHHARLYDVSCSEVAVQEELSTQIQSKHSKGGWSQARFQRIRTGAINRFYDQVVEMLPDDPLIIAGPGQAKNEFHNRLPDHVSDRVVAVIDTEMDDEHALLQASLEKAAAHEQRHHEDLAARLKKEVLTDGLAAYGVEAVQQAARNGQVEVLLVEKDYRLPGWICERCQLVKPGVAATCTNCSQAVSKVDVVEEIIEFAGRTDAIVEFLDSDILQDFGHVAALLRYTYQGNR